MSSRPAVRVGMHEARNPSRRDPPRVVGLAPASVVLGRPRRDLCPA